MAYAFVKKVANSANAAAVTFSPTSGGDLLVVDCFTSSGAGTPTASITDNLSSTWSTAIATIQPITGVWVSRFYIPNCPAGITSITLSFIGGTPGTVNTEVLEYSGIATTTPHIVSNTPGSQAAPGTGTDAITSGAVNVTSQPALFLATSVDSSGHTAVAGTGFTDQGNANGTMSFEDKRLTATGNATATATTSTGGTDTWTMLVSAFAEPALAASPVIAWVT